MSTVTASVSTNAPISTICKLEDTNRIILPAFVIEMLQLKTEEELELTLLTDKIVISKNNQKQRKTITELFANYPETYKYSPENSFDDGSVGMEML